MAKKTAIYVLIWGLLCWMLGCPLSLWAQSTGDCRSAAAGNWSSTSTWQTFNGTSWVSATSLPTSTNNVLIQVHSVIIDNSSAQCKNLTFSNNLGTSNISLSISSGVLSIYGDATFRDHINSISSWTAGARLVFAGTANQLLTTGTQTRFYALEINKSSGTVTQQTGATIRIENSLSISNGGTFVLGASTNIEGVQFSDITVAKTPSISIGVNSTLTISGSSAIRSGTSGSSAISSVSVYGTLNLTSSSSTTKVNLGAVTVGNGTDVAALNISGAWSSGVFNFASITVNNNGTYSLLASSSGSCSQGSAAFNTGSTVVYGVSASSGMPFADTDYYNLTMGRTTSWTLGNNRNIGNNLVVNGGTFTISGPDVVTASLYTLNTSGTCNISNSGALIAGHIKFNLSGDMSISSGSFDGGGVASTSINNSSIHTFGANINISGGTLYGATANSNRSIFNITGSILLSSGNFYASSNSRTTFNIGGDINNTGGNLIGTTNASADPTLNIEGGLLLSGGGICKASNVASPSTTTMLNINFSNSNGNNNISNVFLSTGLTNYEGLWSFSIASGRSIQLQTDVEMGSNTPTTTYTSFDVQSGGKLSMGTYLIKSISGANDTRFNNASNSTLEMGHSGGIASAGTADGNVQTVTRSFVTTGHYTYNGTTNQNTGSGLPSNIKNLTINNSGITGNNIVTQSISSLSIGSNTCYIYTGVYETGTNTFNGSSGNLTMSGGTLRMAKLSSLTTTVFPEMDGTYSITGGTIELYGAGTQILRGGKNYYNVSFSGSNTAGVDYKYLTSAITINNNLDISSSAILNSIDVAGNSVSISGNGGLSMSGTARYRMKKLNVALPELTATNAGTSYALSGGTIELYGSGASQSQSLNGTYGSGTNITYNNIDINASALNSTLGSANVNLGSSIYLNGTLTVFSPAAFQISANYSLRGSGNVEIKSGATFQYGSADGINTGTTTGNIRLSGTRILSTSANYGFISTVSMVSGNQLPSSVRNLFIYKTGNTTCTLSQSLSITGTLSLNSGLIISSSGSILNLTSTASVSGASNSSFVSGPISKIGNTSFLYPCGKQSYYRPISISAPSISTDEFTAEYFYSDPNTSYNINLHDISINHVSRCEYWILNRTAGSSGVNVTLSWDSISCGITDPSALSISRWDGSKWKDHGNGGTTGTLDSGTVVSASPIASFSPFTLSSNASTSNPLPIELISFTGNFSNENITLNWVVSSEKNNAYFSLYRSADGIHFIDITKVKGLGDTYSPRSYSYDDPDFYSGTNYYRLTATDQDGKFTESHTIAVHVLNKTYVFSASGDFNNSQIYFHASEWNLDSPIVAEIIDLSGRSVYKSAATKENEWGKFSIHTDLLSRGFYVLKITNGNEIQYLKFFY